jgi:hypothetical protein
MAAALALIAASCGDGGNGDGGTSEAQHCPEGTTEAYRDGSLLVCNTCASDADCASNQQCQTVCGPGCENDTGNGGCCGVRECISVVERAQMSVPGEHIYPPAN